MNCDELKRVLNDFLNGTLSGEESREARRHLASCNACVSRLDPADRMEVLPVLDDELEPSDDFAERFHRRLQAPRRNAVWRNPLTLAAAAALVLISAALFFGQHFRGLAEISVNPNDLTLAEDLPILENMAVIQNLELLENFDAIEKLTIEEGEEQ